MVRTDLKSNKQHDEGRYHLVLTRLLFLIRLHKAIRTTQTISKIQLPEFLRVSSISESAATESSWFKLSENERNKNRRRRRGGSCSRCKYCVSNGFKREQSWDNRGHFFSAAAEAMRRILVDQARHKETLKAGGQKQRVELSDVEPVFEIPRVDLLALEEALKKLEKKDPRKAELVKLRFFSGLTNQEAASVLRIASSTADLDWAYAKCWLRLEMSGEDD